jgi:adenosine deaminase
MNLSALPKVELHLHLDCSVSFKVASELNPSLTLDQFRREFIAPAKCTNLMDVLAHAARGFELMQTEKALRLVTHDMFEQLAADNVIYAEIRFAPHLHLAQGLTTHDVVGIVDDATKEAAKQSGIEARLILCTLRHYNEEQGLETARLVEKFQHSAVVALDIAGDEAGYPIGPQVAAFEYAATHNLARTAHAGEASGAESVWETLRLLKPMRIGHGVRSVEDPALVAHLKRNNIHLEMCPSSNVQTNAVQTAADHSIDGLMREGVSVGVNTDSRTMGNLTLNEEYARLEKTFAWTPADFLRCNRHALDAAFIPGAVRARLHERLDKEWSAVTVNA